MDIELDGSDNDTMESKGAREAGDRLNSALNFNPRAVMMACASALQEINFKDEAQPLFNLLSSPRGYSTVYQVIVNGVIKMETQDSGDAQSKHYEFAREGAKPALWVVFFPYKQTHGDSFMSIRLYATD